MHGLLHGNYFDAVVVRAGLILDIQLKGMSGMSGIELYRLLLAARATPPVIFITGRDRPDLQRMLINEGAAAYFTKSFNGGELIRAIHQELKPLEMTSYVFP